MSQRHNNAALSIHNNNATMSQSRRDLILIRSVLIERGLRGLEPRQNSYFLSRVSPNFFEQSLVVVAHEHLLAAMHPNTISHTRQLDNNAE